MKKIPQSYLPKTLSKKDRKRQLNMINKSRKMYQKKKFYTRKILSSFTSQKSPHIIKAMKLYKLDKIVPSKQLSIATGCSIKSMKEIVRKGEGAYYSSGSRPNQTAKSWGLARLASSLTGGKASKYDYKIIENGCNHSKKAFNMALKK